MDIKALTKNAISSLQNSALYLKVLVAIGFVLIILHILIFFYLNRYIQDNAILGAKHLQQNEVARIKSMINRKFDNYQQVMLSIMRSKVLDNAFYCLMKGRQGCEQVSLSQQLLAAGFSNLYLFNSDGKVFYSIKKNSLSSISVAALPIESTLYKTFVESFALKNRNQYIFKGFKDKNEDEQIVGYVGIPISHEDSSEVNGVAILEINIANVASAFEFEPSGIESSVSFLADIDANIITGSHDINTHVAKQIAPELISSSVDKIVSITYQDVLNKSTISASKALITCLGVNFIVTNQIKQSDIAVAGFVEFVDFKRVSFLFLFAVLSVAILLHFIFSRHTNLMLKIRQNVQKNLINDSHYVEYLLEYYTKQQLYNHEPHKEYLEKIGNIGRIFNSFSKKVQTQLLDITSNTHTLYKQAETIAGYLIGITKQSQSIEGAGTQVLLKATELNADTVTAIKALSTISLDIINYQKQLALYDNIILGDNINEDSFTKIYKEIDAFIMQLKSIAEQVNITSINLAIENNKGQVEYSKSASIVANQLQLLATKTNDIADSISSKMHIIFEDLENLISVLKNAKQIHMANQVSGTSIGIAFERHKDLLDKMYNDIGSLLNVINTLGGYINHLMIYSNKYNISSEEALIGLQGLSKDTSNLSQEIDSSFSKIDAFIRLQN